MYFTLILELCTSNSKTESGYMSIMNRKNPLHWQFLMRYRNLYVVDKGIGALTVTYFEILYSQHHNNCNGYFLVLLLIFSGMLFCCRSKFQNTYSK